MIIDWFLRILMQLSHYEVKWVSAFPLRFVYVTLNLNRALGYVNAKWALPMFWVRPPPPIILKKIDTVDLMPDQYTAIVF